MPYSTNALATGVVSLWYLSFFFYVYANRSISYFQRMRSSHDKLHEMATRDALTGVLNARAYYSLCDRMIRQAERSGLSFAVLFVDLDHFKAINDTYGHAAGDHVLREVAQSLGRTLRQSDVLGRIGGEEFSILLPDTDLEGAVNVAENLRQAIGALMPVLGGEPRSITASIGVAKSQPGMSEMQAIQKIADQAMYRAKMAGRNRVSCLVSEEG